MLPIPMFFDNLSTPPISSIFSYSFAYEDLLTSPYWFSRSTDMIYDFSTSNVLNRIYGTSSSPYQTTNCFGSSIVFSGGDIISVEVPAIDSNNSTTDRRFLFHNFCWTIDPTYLTYMNVYIGGVTSEGELLEGSAVWVVNGAAMKGVVIPQNYTAGGFKFIWDRSTGMSYIYSGSPNNNYNTLLGTYSMDISSMTIGATNSDPFFFTGLLVSPTQSTAIRTSDNSYQGYDNGYIISNTQYNGLTGSNKDHYISPGLSRINVKY